MTATVTDLFCGAGGSSIGAEAAGMELKLAMNHWQTAIDVHQAHFPNAGHDCADISQADPRRYPKTDVLLASPECTNHSLARGISRKSQDPTLFDKPDPSAERSRATMWDVPRFAEQMHYSAIVVENVVEATKWVGWRGWCITMEDLGYTRQVLSHNSMHHGVSQSRDRIYVIFTKNGIKADLELEVAAHCARCDTGTICRQAWKNGRRVGKYNTQWYWACITCGTRCEPTVNGADQIIDWQLDCPRIGDRKRPLAQKTRARILAGLQRYGYAPITTTGAGNTYERTPGNRAKAITEPLPTQQTTATSALATPPGLVVSMRGTSEGHIANACQPAHDPLGTVSAGGNHHGLLMRNNGGGAEMSTPVTEPARTITTAGHQSLLMPYRRGEKVHEVAEPVSTIATKGQHGLLEPERYVDDCGFRMLEPHEIAAAMAFPDDYIPTDLNKKERVKLAGNAVTPPVMQWLAGRVLQALEAA